MNDADRFHNPIVLNKSISKFMLHYTKKWVFWCSVNCYLKVVNVVLLLNIKSFLNPKLVSIKFDHGQKNEDSKFGAKEDICVGYISDFVRSSGDSEFSRT